MISCSDIKIQTCLYYLKKNLYARTMHYTRLLLSSSDFIFQFFWSFVFKREKNIPIFLWDLIFHTAFVKYKKINFQDRMKFELSNYSFNFFIVSRFFIFLHSSGLNSDLDSLHFRRFYLTPPNVVHLRKARQWPKFRFTLYHILTFLYIESKF